MQNYKQQPKMSYKPHFHNTHTIVVNKAKVLVVLQGAIANLFN